MASTNGVIFPESMVNFLVKPVDICFGSMPATSTAPAVCLVIEGNAVTTNQQSTALHSGGRSHAHVMASQLPCGFIAQQCLVLGPFSLKSAIYSQRRAPGSW
jgi:hypothetical protein